MNIPLIQQIKMSNHVSKNIKINAYLVLILLKLSNHVKIQDLLNQQKLFKIFLEESFNMIILKELL